MGKASNNLMVGKRKKYRDWVKKMMGDSVVGQEELLDKQDWGKKHVSEKREALGYKCS